VKTDRVLTCYRIGDPEGEFPIYETEGSRLFPGRWNTAASPMIYTSEHYSTAMLEKLVHSSGIMPANQHFIRITIPNGTSYEKFQPADHPGWDSHNEGVCKQFGEKWHADARSALLIVPSIPARVEFNFLINIDHPDADAITYELPEPIWWDDRLFSIESAARPSRN
jgi:RES domain-containing protein